MGGTDIRTPDPTWATTAAPLRADATAATAPTAPAAPTAGPNPPPAAQLAARIAPLRTGPDGVHHLTVHLNPVDLGPISVVAQVRGDELSVHLAGATDAGREALRAALPELERDLRDSGFGSCVLEIARDAPQPQHDRPNRPMWTFSDSQPGGGRRDGAPQESQPREPHQSREPHPGPGPRTAPGRSLDLHV